jgi:hypothetical protein
METTGLHADSVNRAGRAASDRAPSAVTAVAGRREAFRRAEARASVAVAPEAVVAVGAVTNRKSNPCFEVLGSPQKFEMEKAICSERS